MKKRRKRPKNSATPVGVIWYRREDYDQLKGMFPDGDVLPDNFDEWLKIANNTFAELTQRGFLLLKAMIDPLTFPEWCRAHQEKMDANGRTRYAAEYSRTHAKPQ